MIRSRRLVIVVVLLLLVSSAALAQRRRGRGRYREAELPRAGVPEWSNAKGFERDVFTFVRVRYGSYGGYGGWGGGGWQTDFPDSDFNFSFRLQQLTALKVNPDPIFLDLTDERLFDYPFLYMIEPGRLYFEDAEVLALRKYCQQGGFLMVDDFWGEDEWENFREQLKRVFPDREAEELPLEHEIFHCVYDLKEKPQVPSIHHAQGLRGTGITWERHDAQTPHYKAIHDDKGRIMVLVCHNTDLGDGWEREGEDEWYFREFAEKKSYPMGINIVFYAMTH
jgi:hypothetical protein